ncbi:MAG: hypothetical protein M0030_12055 [Actinomycetota bacterium]|nr:hypothetical protein [Actinomycetota bacterium]
MTHPLHRPDSGGIGEHAGAAAGGGACREEFASLVGKTSGR